MVVLTLNLQLKLILALAFLWRENACSGTFRVDQLYDPEIVSLYLADEN